MEPIDILVLGTVALACYGLWRLVRPGPALVVTERGILEPSLRLGWIRWDEIEGAYQPTAEDREALRLRVRVTERLRRRLPRRGPASRESMEVRLDLAGSEFSPIELMQVVLSHSPERTAHRDSAG